MGFDNIDVKTTLRYTHPTPENKRKAVEILAAVFGGGSEKVADGQIEERIGVVAPVSGN